MLFRTKRVSEIRAIESNIRHEATEKSDSLRQLLATRYRDLLRAADEIAAIRDDSSHHVRDALRNVSQQASCLRDQMLKRGGNHPTSPKPATDDLQRRRRVHVVGSMLKHIVDSPEVLYACLEQGQVYDAAVRYALADRNYRELGTTSGVEGVANRFAERRWRQVHVFRDQILGAAEEKLVTQGLTSDAYGKAIAALIVLQGEERDIVACLDGMLASRTGWIEDENRKSGKGVVEKLSAIAEVVRTTVSCVAEVFWTEGGVKGLLTEADAEGAKEVARVRAEGKLQSAVRGWVDTVRQWLEENGAEILKTADSSRSLTETLKAVDETFDVENWKGDCRNVLGKPTEFVFDIFKPLISERAATVASESVQYSVESAIGNVTEVWGDMAVGKHAGRQIWASISNDTVEWWRNADENREAYTARRPVSAATEEMDIKRSFASNSPVSDVVGAFEASLRDDLTDIAVLAERVPSVATAFGESVRTQIPRILEKLDELLGSIPVSFSDDMSSDVPSCDQLMERALFVSRAATALRTMECIEAVYTFNASSSHQKDPATIQNYSLRKFSQTAENLALAGYRTWANRLSLRLQQRLQAELRDNDALTMPMGWSGRTEGSSGVTDGESEKTGLLEHPTTISTALMNFILEACRAANRAGGFALPHQAIKLLRDEMSNAAVVSYKSAQTYYCEGGLLQNKAATRTDSEKSDAALMQMFFDILVLQQMFNETGAIDRMIGAKESLKAVEQQLHSVIDPIDLASCKKSLLQAVNGYASRSSILFGTITRKSDGNSPFSKRPSSSPSQLASSNLVSLASTVQRFTYLPAPMPSTYSTTGGGTAGLSAKAALGALRSEATAGNGAGYRKREDTSVAGYASKVSESVGRFGRGFFESLTRKVG
eukprot:GFKZ01008376.1.p1 GENE.GFKZ01008376.1~~GFKZ01008376.1.p1  ORF type:complete len:909 (-),score=157.61 GFKZ01008376.1:52-2718(-)